MKMYLSCFVENPIPIISKKLEHQGSNLQMCVECEKKEFIAKEEEEDSTL